MFFFDGMVRTSFFVPSHGFARSLRWSRASTRENRITRQPLNGESDRDRSPLPGTQVPW